MYTLGINAVYHDPAACLVRDGFPVAAAEEERFTRIKHGKRPIPFSTYELPFHAIDYCLREAGITLSDVNHVAYSYDPFLLLGRHRRDATIKLPLEPSAYPTPSEWDSAWDPLFLASIVNAPRHLASGAPHHLQERFRGVSAEGPYQWHFVQHHLAHAASAFLVSPFEKAAVLTLDGRGEKATTAYWLGDSNQLQLLGQVNFPYSLGLLYEQVTDYLGFLPSSDEYKVMALASFGKPRYLEDFRDIVLPAKDGQYLLVAAKLEERFGPPRLRNEPFEQRHYDIAHSLQVVLEETVLQITDWLHTATQSDYLCMAGGVALNCVLNSRVRDRGPFKEVWVQPAAGDSGTALGAALWVDAQERGKLEGADNWRVYQMQNALLGPVYSDDEIEQFLRWSKLPYRRLGAIAEETAALLEQDKIVGWFQGRMEFGPRALGARSILASPLSASMQARLNELKDREDFRPVAPVVLEEEASQWFSRGALDRAVPASLDSTQGDIEAALPIAPIVSPFMLFVYDVLPGKTHIIPAVRHVDGTARIQTVNREQHPLYYELLKAFQQRTGVPVLVNTSFNTRGEPIVCSPRDAVESFWTSPLDALVIGSFLLEKPQ